MIIQITMINTIIITLIFTLITNLIITIITTLIITIIITIIITNIITLITTRWRTRPQRWQTWTTTAARPGFWRPPRSGILIFLFAFKNIVEYFGVFKVMDHLHHVHVHYFSPLSKFELFISIHTFSKLLACLLLRISYFFAFKIALIVFEYVLSALMEYLHHICTWAISHLCDVVLVFILLHQISKY